MTCFTYRFLLASALLLSLAGCRSTVSCPDGTHFDADGECAAADRDGGDQLDASIDAAAEAGLCGACSGETSLCRESDGKCVACLSDDDCDGERCDIDAGACVECVDHVECADALAGPICVGGTCAACTSNAQCEAVDTYGDVCEDGSCVECTADDRHACDANVCDDSTNTCTTRPANSKGLCQECIADAECMEGQLCVRMRFEETDVGSFCLWREDASGGPMGSCTNVRPYFRGGPGDSIDGIRARVCSLRVTTCEALNQFSMQDCETDDDCGVPGLDDGLCREVDPTTHRCTTPCLSDDDCRLGSSCNVSVTVPYCSFNND